MSSDDRVFCPIHGFRPFVGCCAKEVDGDEIIFVTDDGDVIDFEIVDDEVDETQTLPDLPSHLNMATITTEKAPFIRWLEKERFPREGTVKYQSKEWNALLTHTITHKGDYLLFHDCNSCALVTYVIESQYEKEGGGLTKEYTVWYDFVGQKQRPKAGERYTIIASQPTAPVENGGNRG